ncbi:hypothetical protein PIB30_029596 [Stylosanthes scabra]|uniref:tyrosine--tRNA ligase n=1 Tax=Stylosanthes scabra TaxID=79078 RepID=A0ABU6Y8M1_9FABA|nr:hypothetical protein [Stylosanthes scabra]
MAEPQTDEASLEQPLNATSLSSSIVNLCGGGDRCSSSTSDPNSASQLTLDQKFAIVRSVGEECIEEDELRNLLDKKPEPVCYDGFEPSGRMHIPQGVMKSEDNQCEQADICRLPH